MLKQITLAIAAMAMISGATSVECLAKNSKQKKDNHPQGFQVFDADTGDEIYNDGALDGKACVIGHEVRYDPSTGKFKRVSAVRCN